ncbi:MAG TPA: hypothetical protein VGN55_07865 [Xanthobacteraceae bacterium]|jgi:hypothetical protein
MQKCRALPAAFNLPPVLALFGAFFFTGDIAISDPLQSPASETGAGASNCDSQNVVEYPADQTSESNVACTSYVEIAVADRDYLIDTSTPGSTMVRQGPELAIGRLHPEFVRRLAAAIREARQAGLPAAGIFSAYRPPAFGVGGFSDKFNSLHTYGLAVDMSGIGGPGTAEARLWHEIAARHGVACPYGAANRAEWNHCQPTRIRIVLPENPLRYTVTANGPIDLGSMFEAGDSLIESPASLAEAVTAEATDPSASAHMELPDRRIPTGKLSAEQPAAKENGNKIARKRFGKGIALTKIARATAHPALPSLCRSTRQETCGSGKVETAARLQAQHPRQAAANISRHHT